MTRYIGTSGDDVYAHLRDDSLRAIGLAGNDLIVGNASNDFLDGSIGNDNLSGGDGNDALIGKRDNDTLFGNDGNDLLVGGSGDDYLDGYGYSFSGNTEQYDTLIGGSGADTFVLGNLLGVYYQGAGYATIKDWDSSSDTILVTGDFSQYSLKTDNFEVGSSAKDTGIYYGNDLICIVQDSTNVTLM